MRTDWIVWQVYSLTGLDTGSCRVRDRLRIQAEMLHALAKCLPLSVSVHAAESADRIPR